MLFSLCLPLLPQLFSRWQQPVESTSTLSGVEFNNQPCWNNYLHRYAIIICWPVFNLILLFRHILGAHVHHDRDTVLPSLCMYPVCVSAWSCEGRQVSINIVTPQICLSSLTSSQSCILPHPLSVFQLCLHNYNLPYPPLPLSPVRVLVYSMVRLWSVAGPKSQISHFLSEKQERCYTMMTIETVESGGLIIEPS